MLTWAGLTLGAQLVAAVATVVYSVTRPTERHTLPVHAFELALLL